MTSAVLSAKESDMRLRFLLHSLLLACALLGACKFPELPPLDETDATTDGPGSGDAGPDATLACAPDSITCDAAQALYTECSSSGIVSFQMRCPLGCATGAAKCLDIDPSNGLAMYLDMAAEAPDLVMSGQIVINTSDGSILVGAIAAQVPTFLTTDGIRVFVVRSLTLDGVATVERRYTAAKLAFVSDRDVLIRGRLDISADGTQGGAGGNWGGDQSSKGACAGHWPAQSGPGAGGAGGGEPGAPGGPTSAHQGAAGGSTNVASEPLLGGCEGGSVLDGGNSVGGGGGGGLQITSRTQILLLDSGIIDASGGGAQHGASGGVRIAGAGGGAGGNVILEAPQVVLDGPSVVVSTKGGGGAGASSTVTSSGTDGGYDAPRAAGGTSSIQSHGGAGGNGTQPPGAGLNGGCSDCQGGGGGGAAGMTVFRNLAGAIAPQNGAAVRSKTTTTPIRTRQVP